MAHDQNPLRTWTVAEAQARLSEILRLASDEGPQRIGTQKRYVVVTEQAWQAQRSKRMPMGRWLVENMPRGEPRLEQPSRADRNRPAPLADDDGP